MASGRSLPPGTPKAAVAATHANLMARTPLSRLSSHRAGQDGHDQFRLSASAVDQSGALLLDHSQHPLLAAPVVGFHHHNQAGGASISMQSGSGASNQSQFGIADGNAAGAAGGGRDMSGVALFGAGMDDGDDEGGFDWMGGDDDGAHIPPMPPADHNPWHPIPQRQRQGEPATVPAGADSQHEEENEPDLWAMWDPHAFGPAGVEKPFRKGASRSSGRHLVAIWLFRYPFSLWGNLCEC